MEVCESMPLKDGLELEKKLPKEAMVDCHESVTSEACHKSVTSEACHKSVTSEDCHKSVTSEACHKSVTSEDCHKSVTSDDCHKSVTSDDCHKSVTSDDCHKSVTSEDCHKSVTSEDCHKSVTSEDCHKSVTSEDCHKSVTSDDCHKSLRSEDHSKTPEKEDYHKNVANEDHKRTHDTEDSLDTSAGNEDHQKGRLHGDAVDPYKLNWPGLLSLPVYIIDPNTKTVYEPSNPLPPSQTGLNSVEHKYVMVQSVIDLFTADCRLRALDTLIHLSSLYDLHKFHTIAKVGYMHIGTLLAFLVVYPWCNSFQKVRGSVLQFLIRYIEGQCWLCGFIRRDCRCGTSTYDAEVVQVDHRVEYADKGIQVEPPNTVGNPLTAVLLPGGTQMQPGMRVPMSSFRFSSENPMHMGPSFPAGAQTNGMPRTGMYQVPIPQMNYVPVSANPVTGTDSAAGKSQASPVNTANRFMQQSPGWGGPLTPNTAACMWTMGNGAPYGFTPVMPTTQHSNPGFLSPPQQMMSSRFMPPPFQTPPATAGVTTSTDSANHMTSIVKPGTHVVMPGTTAAGMVPIGMPAPCQLMKPLPAKKFVKNMSTQTRPVAREKRCKGTNYMMSTVKRKSLDDNDKTAGNESEAKKVKGSDTGDVAEGEKTPIRTFTEMQLWRLIEDDEEEDVKNKEKSSSVVSVTSALAGPVENADEETAEAICRRVVTDIVGRVLGETDEAKEARDWT
ncbi:hypothetical protein NP493_146g02015 [Ridgeia piscesae]|uniref:Uncharacterized protein n=1 Tax=Ridgeia piscesae TaxID=27915 RepID=A0AAD9P4L7_RIDPI|nr:hypothetical protein NP493_146g02015 [Ridgeia piscesae]